MDDAEDALRLGARLAGQANLQDIRAFRFDATLIGFPNDELPLQFNLTAEVTPNVDEEATFVVDGAYTLRIYQEQTEGGEGAPDVRETTVAEISANLAALYELPEGQKGVAYSPDEVAAFAETTGKLALYPYLRSLISDLTARLGLPTLVLPTMRLNLASPPVAIAPSAK